jgi:hypothetical protein
VEMALNVERIESLERVILHLQSENDSHQRVIDEAFCLSLQELMNRP